MVDVVGYDRLTVGRLFGVTARRWIFTLIFAVLLVGLDRLTKIAVAESLPLYTSIEVVSGFFNLVHTRNTGIAFSLFSDAGPLVKDVFIPVLSLAALGVIAMLFRRISPEDRAMHWALTLILAGAVGNLYDRAVYGYVVDFLDFYVGGYHWPAFNVADTCISVGAGLLLLDSLKKPSPEKEEAATA